MNPQDVVDMGREAILSGLISVAPLLIIGLVIAVAIGLLQSMFQIQEQSIAVIPKLLLMFVVIALALPWLSERMLDFSRTHFERPILISTVPQNTQ
jgi:flagellar biosynthesis protein FliQ